MVQKHVVGKNHQGAYKTAGLSNLPVCELKACSWEQSENMHKEAPCD
ncbi:hypothetical protein PG995_003139 [Apiospora arundinis]